MTNVVLFAITIHAEAEVQHHPPCVPWCPVCYPLCNTCGMTHPNLDHHSEPIAIADTEVIETSFRF
jgi:hypothetical protein